MQKLKNHRSTSTPVLRFFCRAQCTGSARSGAHRGGRRRPERLKLAGKHRMSMLYRPLVRLPASRGRPEPPGAPLCEAPARARNTRLLEVESDRSRAALRHRPLLPPCQRYPGDSCWPCQRLKHLRPTRRSSSQSGVQKPVGNEWRRWVKLEWLTRFSSETSSKCSGIDLDGLWSISAKEKPGRRRHLTCLEVDQLLERTTSLIPGILLEDGVAVPDLGGWIEVGYGYPPAMVAVPEEHAPPDGRDRGAFGRWEAQRSKYDHAGLELTVQ